MAFVRVRHASMFFNGKKIAEMFSSEEDIASGDEPQYGDEGFVGMSDGATTTTMSFDAIVPTNGSTSAQVEAALLSKQDFDLTLGLIAGKLHQNRMRCTQATYKSDAKAGTLVGSFKFMGGAPIAV